MVAGQHANKIHGWLSAGTWRMIRKHLPDDGIVLELGTWMGKSAQRMLDANANIRLVCVDTWLGSPEINRMHQDMLPTIFDHCRYHLWPYRDRLVLIKATTIEGMETVARLGIKPSLVYIDAKHDAISVRADATTADRWFSGAVQVGDDWARASVREGVIAALEDLLPRHLICNSNAWSLK